MKIGIKMFFCITIFICVMFLTGGYTLLTIFFDIVIERETSLVLQQYQNNKFVLQAVLITNGEEIASYDYDSIHKDMQGLTAAISSSSLLFSDFPKEANFSDMIQNASKDRVDYQFIQLKNRTYLITSGVIEQNSIQIHLITGTDIEPVLNQQKQAVRKFGMIYACTVGIGMFLVFGLSLFLVRPVKRLTAATKKIAEGSYEERVPITSRDETGQLAEYFNQMADAIEEKMTELSEEARQKEDFAANLSHELKTPLTSIIGYANRIYQKELPREEQKQAAWRIWNEGMRLETLAQKLLDLTAMEHEKFSLEEIQADQIIQELVQDIDNYVKEKGVYLQWEAESSYILVEYDLFKTLFLNLIDNACKAGAKHIHISGIKTDCYYIMQISDDGCGIPADEIQKITEAFYMVDKSRSRKQHGAGLGLALAEKIAKLHGGSLEFQSNGKTGTTVLVKLIPVFLKEG